MIKTSSRYQSIIFILSFSLLIFCHHAFSQGETAVPFLLIGSSPEANGMGRISGSMMTNNAMAIIDNPGQIGFQSLDNYFNTAFFNKKTDWLPVFQQQDMTYEARAFNFGLNLQKVLPLPFGLSAGFGYSRINLSLGEFVITNGDPTTLGTYYAQENAEMYSFGIGLEYFIKIGLGCTMKKIESDLTPHYRLPYPNNTPHAYATDIGVVAQLPVTSIIEEVNGSELKFAGFFKPQMDINLSYARSNDGGDIMYISAYQADPLPYKTSVGLNFKFALRYTNNCDVELFSIIHAREAEDILITRWVNYDNDGNYTGNAWSYDDGLGDIQYAKNLLFGETNGRISLRKGFQITMLELFEYRKGSLSEPGLEHTTDGYGLNSKGLISIVDIFAPNLLSENTIFGYFFHHAEIRYSIARYYPSEANHPLGGTRFEGLNIRFLN